MIWLRFFCLPTAILLLLGITPALAQRLPAPPEKKIIQFGWDNATAEFLEKNIEMVEKHSPYDGIGIRMLGYTHDLDGKKFNTEGKMFYGVKFQEEWFDAQVKSLKNIKFTKLKHNFLKTSGPSHMGNFDLFDDQYWEAAYHNYAIFAKIAKETGMKGINFDLEDYGNRGIWKYRPACGQSWPQAYDLARQRGRRFIEVITDQFPDIHIFVFFWLDLVRGAEEDDPQLFENLEGFTSGLMVGFINGIYDALPPDAKIIDGMESSGYAVKNIDSLYRLRARREINFRRLVAPENQKKLREQTSLAVATYLDSYIGEKPPYSFRNDIEEENMTTLEFFRRNFRLGVEFSDEYVWTWNECRKWFPMNFQHGWQSKSLDRNPSVPGPLWAQALPGIEEAIKYGKNPKQYVLQKLASGETGDNLLRNSSFDDIAKQPENLDLAPDSVVLTQLPYWETWQPKHSTGTFQLGLGEGRDGKNAVKAIGTSGGTIHQKVKVKPHGVYVLRALARVQGGAGVSCGVSWRNQQGAWCNRSYNISRPFTEQLENGWRRATIIVNEIPKDSAYMSVMLGSNGTGEKEQIAWFDNIEIREIIFEEADPAQ